METRWSVLTVTTVGIFMASLDASLLVVGLPVVIAELGADLATGSWIITIYRLALTIFLVPIGKLSDMYGRVKLYSLGYFIFAITSLLCSLAPNVYQLLIFRLFQGVGASLMFVNSMAIVTDTFAGRGLGAGIGINQMAINAGTILGYTLSGIVISLYGWRALFLLNVPIGIFGGIWAKKRLKDIDPQIRVEKFDFKGAIILSTALILLMLSLTSGPIYSSTTLFLILSSLLLFVFFIFIERKTDHPMVDFKLFTNKAFTIGNISNLLNGVSFASLAFLISIYLEVVAGLSPLQAGLNLIPLDLTLILTGPISGWISDKIGTRILCTTGLLITGVALIILSNISDKLNLNLIFTGLFLAGLGVGLFRSPNASSVMSSVPSNERGVAAGIRSTVINTSIALSIPFSIAIISTTTSFTKISNMIGSGEIGAADSTIEILNLVQGIKNALLASAILNIIAAKISFLRVDRLSGKSR
ncbi:MAG: MFS transporter [Nitrososphaeria archaeon]|nr:MFS transporter [Nitrososphaeria archaeon]